VNPQPIGPADWAQIAYALDSLVLFVALVIDTSFAVLLGWAILPSLVASADLPYGAIRLRRALLPIAVAAALLMLVALVRGLSAAADVVGRIYPRGIV
jgi:hypothetical protein